MYTGLVHTHSLLRYFILIALLVVIVQSVIGLAQRKPFGKWNDKMSLYLLIFTHLQFLVGIVLYLFVSPRVQFSAETMANDGLRYWAVEHVTGMLIAVVLITVARVTSKKMASDSDKYRRLLVLNGLALVIIVATILLSGLGLFGSNVM